MKAILRYDLAGATWVAEIVQVDDGFRVRLGSGDSPDKVGYREGGVFTMGAAAVKYIRDLASHKFPGVTPTCDSLAMIKSRTGQSVVPDCYKTGISSDKCRACPYFDTCNTAPVPIEVPEEEDDGDFLKRLQKKVKKAYGEK